MSNPNRKPTQHDLVLAAQEFNQWLKEAAAGGVAFLCGGLALSLYGNVRQTEDADLALDLSLTHRDGDPKKHYDTNQLKALAAHDPKHRFIVGPKIYIILYANDAAKKLYVQVDFIDAALFYSPWDPAQMIDHDPRLPVPCLTLPTLLVGKIKSAPERNQPNENERIMKQANDIQDANFAVGECLHRELILVKAQVEHLGRDEKLVIAVLEDFFKLTTKLEKERRLPSMAKLRSNWAEIVHKSGLPKAYGDVATKV
ncbi:hypothetical protein BKA93DRAFT_192975 [Sparassis latifolia]|uniref:Nucleotidyl transferase AbiEii/AbiGii toxin family protein n=1 Tax=Sparassis crispa TaxID=139825 RepID=A0A401GZ96_9APHY|nr:hypothetical protein SCP_1101600 [Sparassis crispa]GBE87483.1 hypothetical protein SCP_1101600 [Sparassis crispa]